MRCRCNIQPALSPSTTGRASMPASSMFRIWARPSLSATTMTRPLALQGPKAAEVMSRYCPKAAQLAFMSATSVEFDGIDCTVSRSGYTGEDGFEISVTARKANDVASALLAEAELKPIGLGARDSL